MAIKPDNEAFDVINNNPINYSLFNQGPNSTGLFPPSTEYVYDYRDNRRNT